MALTIDFDALAALSNLPLPVMMWRVFIGGGWVPVIVAVLVMGKAYWKMLRREHYLDHRTYRLYSIDIPKENEQSPQAVENIFMHLTGTRSTNTKKEEWWEGKHPPVFAFEIISIGGYIQFLVRVEEKYSDLLPALIYAQYPDAELTEVEDYTRAPGVPRKFPHPVYSMFGSEFELSKEKFLPIRTWIEFENKLSQEFKDPMGTLLEGMARLRPDEQLWMQVLCWPLKPKEWVPAAENHLKRMIGAKEKHHEGWLTKAGAAPMGAIETALKYTVHSPEEFDPRKQKSKQEEAFSSQILYLSPADRNTTEALAKKMAKPGFEAKIRFIYLGPNKSFRASAVLSIVRGYLGQFASLASNYFGFANSVTTKRDYWFQTRPWLSYMTLGLYKSVQYRQNRLLNAYKHRHPEWGWKPMLLNAEELASVWHFPVVQVKAPTVRKIESRRGEAPYQLPVEGTINLPKPVKEPTSARSEPAPRTIRYAPDDKQAPGH